MFCLYYETKNNKKQMNVTIIKKKENKSIHILCMIEFFFSFTVKSAAVIRELGKINYIKQCIPSSAATRVWKEDERWFDPTSGR